MNQSAQLQPVSGSRNKAISEHLATAALLFCLGLGLLYVSGFSSLHAVHNAAHDARHSAAFPCH